MRRMTGVLVALFVLAGCGDEGPTIPEFDGQWEGTLQGLVMEMTVNENDEQEISGNGTFQGSGGSLAFSVDGIHSHPDVSFTISASGLEDANFTGEFGGDDEVAGQVNGSGFQDAALTLMRQD